jgi:hypothetical protein
MAIQLTPAKKHISQCCEMIFKQFYFSHIQKKEKNFTHVAKPKTVNKYCEIKTKVKFFSHTQLSYLSSCNMQNC